MISFLTSLRSSCQSMFETWSPEYAAKTVMGTHPQDTQQTSHTSLIGNVDTFCDNLGIQNPLSGGTLGPFSQTLYEFLGGKTQTVSLGDSELSLEQKKTLTNLVDRLKTLFDALNTPAETIEDQTFEQMLLKSYQDRAEILQQLVRMNAEKYQESRRKWLEKMEQRQEKYQQLYEKSRQTTWWKSAEKAVPEITSMLNSLSLPPGFREVAFSTSLLFVMDHYLEGAGKQTFCEWFGQKGTQGHDTASRCVEAFESITHLGLGLHSILQGDQSPYLTYGLIASKTLAQVGGGTAKYFENEASAMATELNEKVRSTSDKMNNEAGAVKSMGDRLQKLNKSYFQFFTQMHKLIQYIFQR